MRFFNSNSTLIHYHTKAPAILHGSPGLLLILSQLVNRVDIPAKGFP